MSKNKFAIVFVGPPGCGKGTQASLLCKEKDFHAFSTGDEIRKEIATGSAFGNKLKQICDKGELVSDDIILNMVKNFIDHLDTNRVLFDGFPRTISQAENLNHLLLSDELWNVRVFDFHVDDEIVFNRILGRFSCKACGQGYNDKTLKTKVAGICDKCGGTDFIRRDDDNEKTLMNRLKAYKTMIHPIIDFYKNLGVLETVEASLNIDVVWSRISASIDGFVNS